MNIDSVEVNRPFSLVEEITAMITEAGHPSPDSWKTGLKAEVYTAQDVNHQRFIINRHWVQIFTSLPIDQIEKTRDARGCLMNGECDLADYMRLFKLVVVPCAIELNLLPHLN